MQEKPLDKLADMVFNVLWQDQLELWAAIRKKMDSAGRDAVRTAFEGARSRFLSGPFKDHLEVRWGMNLCMHCNDSNIEKNGLAFVAPNGDGLEFNQCLNCRVGLLYSVQSAKARLDTYTIALGKPNQFNKMSIYWDAIVPDSLKPFRPLYEVISEGKWIATVSYDEKLAPRFLPTAAMAFGSSRSDAALWKKQGSADLMNAMNSLVASAKHQIEVALAIR